MWRFPAAIAACLMAATLFAQPASADDRCRSQSSWSDAPAPAHQVRFVFTGVADELVVLSVDETPIFESRLTTEDWSTEFSGATQCVMAGRYRVNVKIGAAEGNLHFEVSEETTIYFSARDGVLTFNVWGPNASGHD